MRNRIIVELTITQLEQLIGKLSLKEKLKLVKKLEKETIKTRWRGLLKDIDKKIKRFPISQREINKEVKNYRKEKHAKSYS